MLRCVQCGNRDIRVDESNLPNFLSYPGKIQMKCGKCNANYIEEYVMGQQVKKDKGKLKVVKVDSKKPKGCIDCGNAEVDLEDRISFGVDDVVVQVTCPKCNSKYEESYYRNRITDLKGVPMKLEQKTLDEKPEKSKKSKAKAKPTKAAPKAKVKPKPKTTQTVAERYEKIKLAGKTADKKTQEAVKKRAAEIPTKSAMKFYGKRPKGLSAKISKGRK